ncbi:hypothetical protein [Hymenobacter cellulosilyticus]|uniref:Uncharacterized protein n=1 Tax=Hymenobacter cellulosilyticus TaxID=2932248 RepID=A0A8T9Q8P2_9BACT|nr:hypothetical protein [Hymenobacter cellulosilyticus]UOQ73907.1 hypothetical protein MUN79_08415 [Hymenobacter cellulosilyticus]
MKYNLLLALLFLSLSGFGQGKTVHITLDKARSRYFDPQYTACVDSALAIMNAVFSSAEFQTRYADASFPKINYCDEQARENQASDFITGPQMYSTLFQAAQASWAVKLKRRGPALGSTLPHTGITTAYYKNIRADMPELPRAYALAVNLCHEYMHELEYCHRSNRFNEPDAAHPDPEGYQKDIAYRVGWDAFYQLVEWVKQGKPIPDL